MRHKIIIPIIFLVALFAPMLDMIFNLDPFSHLFENRPMANRPTLSPTFENIKNFPKSYTAYFRDHFGFRNTFVRLNFLIRQGFLKSSPSPYVVIGKEGWLFYTGEKTLDDFRGITTYDDETLRKWAGTLELKRKWLAGQGIKYLFVVAPNKETIYGEFIPGALNKVRNKTGLDEFVDYIRKNTAVEVVDLRNVIVSAKKQEQLYYKTDTHWNNYGAFLAYREIMKSLSTWYPQLQASSLEHFEIKRKEGYVGDLASMVGGAEFLKEQVIEFNPLKPRKSTNTASSDSLKLPYATFTMKQDNPELIRAITFRDSFFNNVIPFLSEHFNKNTYIWFLWKESTPIEDLIATEKPDVVIEEVVERMIKRDMQDFITNRPKFCEELKM